MKKQKRLEEAMCIYVILSSRTSLKGMATHSSIAWRIPWTEEPGRL